MKLERNYIMMNLASLFSVRILRPFKSSDDTNDLDKVKSESMRFFLCLDFYKTYADINMLLQLFPSILAIDIHY